MSTYVGIVCYLLLHFCWRVEDCMYLCITIYQVINMQSDNILFEYSSTTPSMVNNLNFKIKYYINFRPNKYFKSIINNIFNRSACYYDEA